MYVCVDELDSVRLCMYVCVWMDWIRLGICETACNYVWMNQIGLDWIGLGICETVHLCG